MSKKFSFWIWGAIIFQWLTAAVHTVGQIVGEGAEVTDEKEKQLMDLMVNYKKITVQASFAALMISFSH